MSRRDQHENLAPKQKIKRGTDKSFGFVFSIVAGILGLWPILEDKPLNYWALGISAVLVVISLARPQILTPFNRLWFLIGILLHKIVNPIIMGFIFYVTVTPIGVIMRLLGKRPLHLEFDPKAESYWIERSPPGPEPETIIRQF